ALCQQSYRIAFGMSERRFTSQTFSTHITDTEGQCLARVGANLEAFTGQSTIQQVLATEGGSFSNTGQLARQVGELLVQRLTFFSRVRAVGSLQSQVTHPLHDIGGLLESAFSGLGHGDTIVSVLHGNVQTIDLAGQTVGNLQTCGVILSAVDTRTGRQTLQGSGQGVGRTTQVALSVQGSNVAVYCQGHGSSPLGPN